MAFSKRDLKTLLAQGRLEQALATLAGLTERSDDAELRRRVLTLSGQFAALKQQHLTGLLEDKDYRLQWNRIAAAVADIADNLTPSETTHKRRWRKWAAIFVVLAGIAAITGYTLRDSWQNKRPEPLPQRVSEPITKDTIVLVIPPADKPAGKAATGGNRPAPAQKDVEMKIGGGVKGSNIIIGNDNQIKHN